MARTPPLSLFLVLFAFGNTELQAQWLSDPVFEENIQRGIDQIYNLEFPGAEKTFGEVVALQPKHPVGHFFLAMTQWWRILTGPDDENEDDKFYEMLENVIALCDDILERNPEDVTALFFKGGSLGFRGRLRAYRNNWFGAARDGLEALPIVRKAHQLDPGNDDVLLGIGIYNYYAEIVPKEYPIVRPFMLFFPDGDRNLGLQQLRQASEKSKYAHTEATYFLMQSYFLYEKEYQKALELAKALNTRYPRNSVFQRSRGRCNVSVGDWPEAFRIFSDVQKKFQEHQTGYDAYDGREAEYYIATYYFTFGNLPEALKHFFRCDELSRGIDRDGASGFMSMANLRIGMIYDLQSKRREALLQYTKVLKMKEFESSRLDAQRFIETPYKK